MALLVTLKSALKFYAASYFTNINQFVCFYNDTVNHFYHGALIETINQILMAEFYNIFSVLQYHFIT